MLVPLRPRLVRHQNPAKVLPQRHQRIRKSIQGSFWQKRSEEVRLLGRRTEPFTYCGVVRPKGSTWFLPTANDHSGAPVRALVAPQSGTTISVYEAPPQAGAPACMARAGEILFTRESKSGALEIARYTPE